MSYRARSTRRVTLLIACVFSLLMGALARAESTSLRELLPGLKGKVVLLDFWASWCEPCRHSFPWMTDLQQRYGEDLVVVAVNMDQDRALAKQFLTKTPAGFRVEFDPQGVLATQFEVSAMPTSVLIDRRGQVRSKHRGFREAERASREQAIVSLMKE